MCDKLQPLAKVSHPRRRRQFSPPAAAYANDAIILCVRKCLGAFCVVGDVSICEIKRSRSQIIIIVTLWKAPRGALLWNSLDCISPPESNAFQWALNANQ
jgi:hypothetical protein